MNTDHQEKRKYPRAPIRVEILCDELQDNAKRGTGILCFFATDISLGGVFLETTVPFSIGSTLHLKFRLPHVDHDITVVGKIVRTNEDHPNLLPGIGIEFVHVGYDDKRLIEGYIVDELADQL